MSGWELFIDICGTKGRNAFARCLSDVAFVPCHQITLPCYFSAMALLFFAFLEVTATVGLSLSHESSCNAAFFSSLWIVHHAMQITTPVVVHSTRTRGTGQKKDSSSLFSFLSPAAEVLMNCSSWGACEWICFFPLSLQFFNCLQEDSACSVALWKPLMKVEYKSCCVLCGLDLWSFWPKKQLPMNDLNLIQMAVDDQPLHWIPLAPGDSSLAVATGIAVKTQKRCTSMTWERERHGNFFFSCTDLLCWAVLCLAAR